LVWSDGDLECLAVLVFCGIFNLFVVRFGRLRGGLSRGRCIRRHDAFYAKPECHLVQGGMVELLYSGQARLWNGEGCGGWRRCFLAME
jgi:hypothetical protein